MPNSFRVIMGYSSGFFVGLLLLCCAGSIYAKAPNGEPISADQAFVLQVQVVDKKNLEFYWQIAEGYHIYQDQLKILNASNVELLNAKNLPKGKETNDPVLGKSVEYEHELVITLPINDLITKELLVHYQGCSTEGFCYEPVDKLVRMHGTEQPDVETTLLNSFPKGTSVDYLASEIKNAFLPLTLLIFFGLGFLLSFSPCVLPMIPLVVNLIVGSEKMSMRKSATLASAYVLGMAGSYAIAGTLVGMLGAQLQAWMQQPFILVVFSILLILLALSQLELIKIKVPTFNRKLHHWGQKQLQGSLPGAFVLGIISSLIVSPCITPPLIGVLTYIGQNGNPFVGGLTLFMLGLGMGVPLIIVAMLSNVILPKAGRWMNLIKVGTAVALLALAIWILQRIIDPSFTLILWAGLCIIFAVYLRKGDKFLQFGALILAIVALIFIGTATVKQYKRAHAPEKKISVPRGNAWNNIQNKAELEIFLERARSKNMYTMLEVTANWCTSCKKIELAVLPDPAVKKALKNLMLLRVDVSSVTDAENELLSSLHVYGPPAILFFNPQGEEIEDKRLVGAVTVEELLDTIDF